VSVSAQNYSTTQYLISILNNNTAYSINAYLTPNQTTVPYTFFIKDDRDQALSGALVSFDYIGIDGKRYNYFNGYTDISGAVIINVNEQSTYYLTVTYGDLLPKTDSLVPHNDAHSYTIHLSRAISTTYQQYAGSNYYLAITPTDRNYSLNTPVIFSVTALARIILLMDSRLA